MKHLNYLIIFLLLACSSNHKHYDPKFQGFTYSWDSLINPKVFVYYRIDSPKLKSYIFLQAKRHSKDSLIISTQLNISDATDSNIYLVSGNLNILIETYMICKHPLQNTIKNSKGKILINFNQGSFQRYKAQYFYPFDKSFVIWVDFQRKFDTISNINFKQKTYPCIIYTDKADYISKYKLDSARTEKRTLKTIYAKGFGLVQYTVFNQLNNQNLIWKLDTIMNYKDYKK